MNNFPWSAKEISASADGSYYAELTIAISSFVALAAIVCVAWMVIYATYAIIRLITAHMSAAIAAYLTIAIFGAVIAIGLLNR